MGQNPCKSREFDRIGRTQGFEMLRVKNGEKRVVNKDQAPSLLSSLPLRLHFRDTSSQE